MNQDLSQQLQQQVVTAAALRQTLQIRGGNSKAFLGQPCEATSLDVSQHRGIVSYDPVELVVTARAGTPIKALEQVLADNNQMLPFEPPHFGENATLGGTIAVGLSGPSRPFAGSVRDYVLGVKMINGRGEILRFGGQVMKNVAGYDCSRLMAGAMGTLGVLLEISLKVLPKPAAEITLIQTMSANQALETMYAWAAKSIPLSAACYDGKQLYLRLSGSASAVAGTATLVGGDALDNGADFWRQIKEHQYPFFQTEQPLWRLSLPATAPLLELPGQWLIDWGGAQRWLASDADAEQIREQTKSAGGHATLFRNAAAKTDRFQTPDQAVMVLHKRLKNSFDPKGILNPGRLYTDL